MELIVDSNNNPLGYLVDYVFYNNYFIDLQSVCKVNRICGIFTKTGILTKYGLCKHASSVLNLSNYFYFLVKIKDTGIKLNNIIFIPCNFADLDIKEEINQKGYIYICLDSFYLDKIGYLYTKQDIYSSRNIYINMLECINKNKGYGTKIVNQLKSLDKNLDGLSLYTAKKFWEKQGVVFKSHTLYFSI